MISPGLTPELTPNALTVLARRYLRRDENGHVLETPEDLFRRVARVIAAGDSVYGANEADVHSLASQFYGLMASLRFLPNSPTLMNAGLPLGQLSACFVLPVDDSMVSIFDTLKHTALIHQSGGGTGFSFSRLRPAGSVVRSSMGNSSGPVSFMSVYNAATEAIKQGGTRRGANMGILRVDHPDIREFIHCKDLPGRIVNFNISVGVTDEFMQAYQSKTPFALRHPGTGNIVETVDPVALFDEIVYSAWQTGEPGMIFVDTINRDNPTPKIGAIESTNPCGEVPLLPYEACNLGSLNLGRFVTTPVANSPAALDWEALQEAVYLSVHFLENVITQNQYPLPEIEAMVLGNRKIGLGLMGWADLLMALNLPYHSEEAFLLAEDVAAFVDYHSKKASVKLAQERGAFPNFAESRYATKNWQTERHQSHSARTVSLEDWQLLDEAIHKHGLRHATTTCVAPTGTISIIAGASGGIEPVFSLVYERNIMDGTRLPEVHPRFLSLAREQGFYSDALIEQIGEQGSIQGMAGIPEAVQRVYVTTRDIAPESHVRMQAVFQRYNDNGVSKTINFPQEASTESVAHAFSMAYQQGIKGMTVYRNNSRADQPMALGHHEPENNHLCPECSTMMRHGEGCWLCPACAYSVCSV
ncbi:MAG: adenosylcobalamin-dependent ribonucleoside-diphosphate reductase [Cyanobacteria bacterium]|nr:adenosylcobalamin-dependent ribonucleoside-diphosphate reductase [Cyanobacteriota bacterium]